MGRCMEGAIVARNQSAMMGLSESQIDEVAWSHDDGEEPDGG